MAALQRGLNVSLVAHTVSPDLVDAGAVWIRVPQSRGPALIADRLFAYRAAKALAQHRRPSDIVLANGACLFREEHDINAVHFVHSTWLRSHYHVSQYRRDLYGIYQWFYTFFNAHWERNALRRALAIVAVSRRVRDDLIESGCPPQQVRVVTNGVDIDEFAPGLTNRETLGLPSDVPLALFAGDIRTPRKNIETVLRSLSKLSSLHLAVAGATEGSPYPALADKIGVSDRVHFLGFRRDTPALMRAADVFVFPSRYEACTLVLMEAAASGTPVVTAATAGGAELVHPSFGRVVDDPDDEAALADAIWSIVRDKNVTDRMSKAARAAAEQHSWDTMASKYLDLVEGLL